MAATSYKLVKQGDPYRVTLADPDFTSGLLYNRYYLYDESGTYFDVNPMTEMGTSGVYFHDLTLWTPGVYTIIKHALEIGYKEVEVIQIVDNDMANTAFEDPFSWIEILLVDLIFSYVNMIYTTTNQIKTIVDTLKDIEVGDWKIEGSQLIFKNKDTDVEIARFNLLDESGNPTTDKEQVNEVQGI